jgi:hypothetical protein
LAGESACPTETQGWQAEAPAPHTLKVGRRNLHHQNTNEKLCCFLDFLDFLGSFQNFAVSNTRGADANAARGAVDQGAYRLQIHIPATLRNIMGVADSIAELRALSTNCANLCHTKSPDDSKQNCTKIRSLTVAALSLPAAAERFVDLHHAQ